MYLNNAHVEQIKEFVITANKMLALKVVMDGYDDGYTDGTNDVLDALAATIGTTRRKILSEATGRD